MNYCTQAQPFWLEFIYKIQIQSNPFLMIAIGDTMRRTPLAELLQNELERQDFHPRLPGYKRVYEAIRSAIVNRRLPAGSKLPS